MRFSLKYGCLITFVFFAQQLTGQCVGQIKAFKPGERITYKAYYNWGPIWVHAADVQFTVGQRSYLGRQAYSFEANGNSLKKFDWVYKVRDRFQSLVDMETYNPMWFERKTEEGGYKAYENYFFTLSGKIYSTVENSDKPNKKDTIQGQPCTFDILSLVYFSRTIDFSKYKANDKIPVKTIVDSQIYPLYIRYLGKETIKIEDGRKFKCEKFSALLIKGTIFKGGEDMFIWVTDDENHIPVLVEAKILIGSVKAYLDTTEGASHDMKAQVK